MSQNLDTAAKCFLENFQLFGNAQTEPEKFNLYNGLRALAEGMREIEMRVSRLEKQQVQGVNAILQAIQQKR